MQVDAKQELDRHRLRKLGRSAPAAVALVEAALEAEQRGLEHPLAESGHACRATRRSAPAARACSVIESASAVPDLLDLGAPLAPRGADAVDHLAERGQPVARHVGEVGAAVERLAVGRQEDAHRPAALAGHVLDRVHVDRVEVGPLLAVDLDRRRRLVERRGGRLVLERLALHDVAPVARRVADRQEDRLVLGARPRQRLFAPRVPIDRVVGVLEQVRAGLAGESVA